MSILGTMQHYNDLKEALNHKDPHQIRRVMFFKVVRIFQTYNDEESRAKYINELLLAIKELPETIDIFNNVISQLSQTKKEPA